MDTRDALLDRLDRSVGRHAAPRMQRLLRHPIETIRRSHYLRHRTSNAGETFRVAARSFFGEPIYVTVPPAEELWLCGLYLDQSEINLTRYLIRHLNAGDVFFDVGAHFGYYSLL